MARSFETVILSQDDGVATITLNRPEVLNAQSPKLFADLEEAIDEASSDSDTKAVIITGAGRAFCAGGDKQSDLSAIRHMSSFEFRTFANAHTGVIRKMVDMEKPVIAAVNGVAVGGGAELALACDIRFASENAQFGWFFLRRGLIPDLGGTYFLPRLVGIGKAKMLAFTGDLIDAREAERIGIVDKLFSPEELMPATKKFAKQLASGPTRAIAMAKVAMNRCLNMDLASSLDYTSNLQYLLVQTEDHREGVDSFLEKRKPVFKGK